MDAVGSTRAAILGLSEGGSLATLFAAHHPERCQALVLWGAFAKFNSWIPTPERLNAFFDYVEQSWGTGGNVVAWAPYYPERTGIRARMER